MLISYLMIGCKNKPARSGNADHVKVSPFSMAINIHYYPTTISLSIHLTQDELKVSRISKKDSFQFTIALRPTVELSHISTINFKGLKSNYSNPCIDDGLGMDIIFEKGSTRKEITIDNYYREEVDKVIQFVNLHMPVDHRIAYDKNQLLSDQERCKTLMKSSE